MVQSMMAWANVNALKKNIICKYVSIINQSLDTWNVSLILD